MTELVLTLVSAALLNNFVLHWPLGVDPLLAGSRRQVHALGLATLCLMLVVGVAGYAIWHWLLVPLQIEALRLFVFLPLSVLLIAPLLKLLTRWLPGLPFDGLWPLLLGNAGARAGTDQRAKRSGPAPRDRFEPRCRVGFLVGTEPVPGFA